MHVEWQINNKRHKSVRCTHLECQINKWRNNKHRNQWKIPNDRTLRCNINSTGSQIKKKLDGKMCHSSQCFNSCFHRMKDNDLVVDSLPAVPVGLKLKPGLAGWLPNRPPVVAPAPRPVPNVEPVPSPVVPVPKPPGLLAPNRPPPVAAPMERKSWIKF